MWSRSVPTHVKAIGILTAHPGKAEELRALLDGMVARSRQVTGLALVLPYPGIARAVEAAARRCGVGSLPLCLARSHPLENAPKARRAAPAGAVDRSKALRRTSSSTHELAIKRQFV